MKQTKICVCGNHCCHTRAKKRKMRMKNEFKLSFSFIRHNCGDCGQWLGDEILKAPGST